MRVRLGFSFTWSGRRLRRALSWAFGGIGFGAALSVAVLLGARWRAATPGVRRTSASATAGVLTLLFLCGLLLIPVVFLAGIWRTWVARAAVADLLVEIGE